MEKSFIKLVLQFGYLLVIIQRRHEEASIHCRRVEGSRTPVQTANHIKHYLRDSHFLSVRRTGTVFDFHHLIFIGIKKPYADSSLTLQVVTSQLAYCLGSGLIKLPLGDNHSYHFLLLLRKVHRLPAILILFTTCRNLYYPMKYPGGWVPCPLLNGLGQACCQSCTVGTL